MRILLLPFSFLFRVIVFVRNKLYDSRLLKVSYLNGAVISVGNLTTGGAGKTPMTEYLAEYFLQKKRSVAVVTRGYKRTFDDIQVAEIGYKNENPGLTTEHFGDESMLLLQNLSGAEVEPGKGLLVVSDDKLSGAKLADKKFKPDVIILDDGFQHRAVARNLDILLIHANMPKFLLPAGNLREPLRNMKRADLLVLNKKFRPQIFDKLETRRPGMIVSKYEFEHFLNSKGEKLDLSTLAGNTHATAFCGIGDPGSFRDLLKDLNIALHDFIEFPDHHNFKEEDIKKIIDGFQKTNAGYIFTTQKDMVRLMYSASSKSAMLRKLLHELPLYYARIKMRIWKNESSLHEKLNKLLRIA